MLAFPIMRDIADEVRFLGASWPQGAGRVRGFFKTSAGSQQEHRVPAFTDHGHL